MIWFSSESVKILPRVSSDFERENEMKTCHVILYRNDPNEPYFPLEVLVGDRMKVGIRLMERIDQLEKFQKFRGTEFNGVEVPVEFVE